MPKMIRSLVLFLMVGLLATGCEKAADGPRDVYATMEIKKAGGAQSYFFMSLRDPNLAYLGGVGTTGAESPIKKTGQTFTVQSGTSISCVGELFNDSGASNVFWSDAVVKVYVNGRAKWTKRFNEGDSYSGTIETFVVE